MKHTLDPSHNWAMEIGRLMIAFGSIEHVTVICLQQLPPDKIPKAAGRSQLAPRIDALCIVLSKSEREEDRYLLKKLEQARKLVDKRNLIVHNPLVLDVYKNDKGLRIIKKSIKSLRNSERHISFSDLRLVRNEAEALASDLYEAASTALLLLRV